MHRLIRDRLEEVLAASQLEQTGVEPGSPAAAHLEACQECREEVSLLRQQAALLRQWHAPEVEPRPGFYARVMDRIEAQGPGSIWNLFFDSAFGRRIAVASLALSLLMGVYVVSTEKGSQEAVPIDNVVSVQPQLTQYDQPGMLLASAPDQDAVLVNLVTYRVQ